MFCDRRRGCGRSELALIAALAWATATTAGIAADAEKPAHRGRRSYDFAPPRPGEMRDNPAKPSGMPPSLAQFTPAQDGTSPNNGAPARTGASAQNGSQPSAPQAEIVPSQARLAERIARAGMAGVVAAPPADAAEVKVLAMLGQSLGALPTADPLPGSKALDALTNILALPLACRFQAVSVGQFNGLDYGPGVPSGTSAVVVAASGDDLRQGRGALLDQSTAAAARLRLTEKQALFVEADPGGDVATLTLFTAAGAGGGYPAILARQSIFGRVPVLVQSTGMCRTSATTH